VLGRLLIRRSTFDVRHSTFLCLLPCRVPVFLRVLHRPATHAPPHLKVASRVARPAQGHHGEGIAVVGMMQLDRPPAAVGAAIGHHQQPQLAQAPRRHPGERPTGMPPPVSGHPCPRLGGMAESPRAIAGAVRLRGRCASGAHPRAALRPGCRVVQRHAPAATHLALPAAPPAAVTQVELHQVLLLAARRARFRERAVRAGHALLRAPPRRFPGVVAPHVLADTRLTPRLAAAQGTPQIELHPVLLLPTLRARFRQRVLRVGNPVHAMSLLGHRALMVAPGPSLDVVAAAAGGSRFRVPGSGGPPARGLLSSPKPGTRNLEPFFSTP